MDELKESEINLEHIKINNKRKAHYAIENSMTKTGRKKFLSLQTSLP
jgi:hypothetical protein